MIIEMRTLRTKPGRRAEFLEDPDVLFLMRGFPDLESRETMKAQFYEGPLWKDELESLLLPLLEAWDVVLVDVPDNTIRW